MFSYTLNYREKTHKKQKQAKKKQKKKKKLMSLKVANGFE